jgi:hypothetical protein
MHPPNRKGQTAAAAAKPARTQRRLGVQRHLAKARPDEVLNNVRAVRVPARVAEPLPGRRALHDARRVVDTAVRARVWRELLPLEPPCGTASAPPSNTRAHALPRTVLLVVAAAIITARGRNHARHITNAHTHRVTDKYRHGDNHISPQLTRAVILQDTSPTQTQTQTRVRAHIHILEQVILTHHIHTNTRRHRHTRAGHLPW